MDSPGRGCSARNMGTTSTDPEAHRPMGRSIFQKPWFSCGERSRGPRAGGGRGGAAVIGSLICVSSFHDTHPFCNECNECNELCRSFFCLLRRHGLLERVAGPESLFIGQIHSGEIFNPISAAVPARRHTPLAAGHAPCRRRPTIPRPDRRSGPRHRNHDVGRVVPDARRLSARSGASFRRLFSRDLSHHRRPRPAARGQAVLRRRQ